MNVAFLVLVLSILTPVALSNANSVTCSKSNTDTCLPNENRNLAGPGISLMQRKWKTSQLTQAASMLQSRTVNRGPGFMCLSECFDAEETCMKKCDPADKDCENACVDDAKQCSNSCWAGAASMLQTQAVNRGPGFMCLSECFDAEEACVKKCDPADKDCENACVDDAKQCSNSCWAGVASVLQTQAVKRGPGFMCLSECFDAEETCVKKCDPADKDCENACVDDAKQCSNNCWAGAASM